ncbi:MAG: hypothetical protein VX589_20205 [Myxococcota bacterium]|nr:hypothetical protein [Myxococcota bacterium]
MKGLVSHLMIILVGLGVFGVCFAEVPAPGEMTDTKSTSQPEATKSKETPAKPDGDAVKKTTKAAAPITALKVSCAQSNTEVLIDGTSVGTLPLPGPWVVKAGSHQVEFRSQGRPAKTVQVTAAPGVESTVDCSPTNAALSGDQASSGPSKYRWAPMTTSDVGFGVAIAGLVSLGIGAWYGRESVKRADEAAAMRIRQTYRRDFERLADLSESSALAANLSFGIGTAALIGGLAMAFFGEGGLFAISADEDATGVMIQGEF